MVEKAMLADAYLPQIAAGPVLIGILSVAILVETPIAAAFWRSGVLRSAVWVCLANIVSTLFGATPIFLKLSLWSSGLYSDPWYVYTHEVYRKLGELGIMFAITLAIEGVVYVALNLLSKKRTSAGKLIAGLLGANIVSYALLGAYIATRDYGSGDFEFRPDTSWLAPCEQRAMFVDPDSHQLCSIRLDGADRRTEMAEPLGRFDTYLHDLSLYANLPERQEILFVSDNHQWKVSSTLGTTHLKSRIEDWQRDCNWWPTIQDHLKPVLAEVTGGSDKNPTAWSTLTPRAVHPMYMCDRSPDFYVECATYHPDGTGSLLEVRTPEGWRYFGIRSGIEFLGCRDPSILPDQKLVVFRCGGWLMVMDLKTFRVGRLCRGDSLVVQAPVCNYAIGCERLAAGELARGYDDGR